MKELIPNISIDCVILTFHMDELKVLLVKHASGISKDKWGLPGGWIAKDECINTAAHRILYLLTGLKDIYLEQFKTFGAVDRFPEKRVITVAFYSLIKAPTYDLIAGYTASQVRWFNFRDLPHLIYDHDEIYGQAIEDLQIKVKRYPIIFNLLPEKFTLLQLQLVYESLLGITLDKPNFRRKILKMGILKKSNEKQRSVSHRAAVLYEFDSEEYSRIRSEKFVLDF